MNIPTIFADPDFIWAIIPVTALMIPIVAILTYHQRKMAEIMHRSGGENHLIANLQREIYELRQQLNAHTVVLDDLGMRPSVTPLEIPPHVVAPPPPPVPPRF